MGNTNKEYNLIYIYKKHSGHFAYRVSHKTSSDDFENVFVNSF